jgi:hypothetical protein
MSTCVTNPCPHNRHRIPCQWIDLFHEGHEEVADRGVWADYNCSYDGYERLQNLDYSANEYGVVCKADRLPKPEVSDFPDLTSSREAC